MSAVNNTKHMLCLGSRRIVEDANCQIMGSYIWQLVRLVDLGVFSLMKVKSEKSLKFLSMR